MKQCIKCFETKPLLEYHKDCSKQDGHSSTCKECAKAKARQWYYANKERANKSTLRYHEEHRELQLERMRENYQSNQAHYNALGKIWREENLERKAMMDKTWREANKDRTRSYGRKYMTRRTELIDASGWEMTDEFVYSLFDKQNGLCNLCKKVLDKNVRSSFHTDHIVALSRHGEHTPTNIQILCPKCNNRKSNKLISELAWVNNKEYVSSTVL